jgi:hypothetical protein
MPGKARSRAATQSTKAAAAIDNAALSARWLSRKYALYFVDGRIAGRVKE